MTVLMEDCQEELRVVITKEGLVAFQPNKTLDPQMLQTPQLLLLNAAVSPLPAA
jgi:hypothetical protein